MAKKKQLPIEKETVITPEEKTISNTVSEISPELESRFNSFEKTVSEFPPESEFIAEGEQRDSAPLVNEQQGPTIEEQAKVKMFLGLCSYFLVGFNTFLLNFLRKSNVPFDKLKLTEDEIAEFEPYVSGPEILKILSKVPAWLIGVVHFEYMMFTKHSMYVEEYKKENKKIKK